MQGTRLAAALFAASIASVALAAEGVRIEDAALHRAEGSPYHEATGGVIVRSGSDYDRIVVVVRGVPAEVNLQVLIGDGHENLLPFGAMPSGQSEREVARTNAEGQELPGGVDGVDALAGRRLVVRDGEERVVLLGEVPHLPPVDGPGEGEGDGDGDHDEPAPDDGNDGGDHEAPAEPEVARSFLLRGENAPEHARGIVVTTRRGEGERFLVEVANLAERSRYELWVASAIEGDDRVLETGELGGAAFSRDTAHDQWLPAEAESLDDLAGRRVEVRHEDEVVLYGAVPHLEAHDAPVHEEETVHDEATGARVHVEVDVHARHGERLRIEMADLPRHDDHAERDHAERAQKASGRRVVELLIEDDGGNLVPVDTARMNRRGRALLQWRTRRGDNLPLDAGTIRELAGRAFEVRVGGERVASGSIPSF